MKKRNWWKLTRSALGIVLTSVLLASGCGGSDSSGTTGTFDTTKYGPNLYEQSAGYYAAGISSEELEFFASPEQGGRQRLQNWCWAACIQMILNYHGISITQEEIVQLVFGAQVNEPASSEQILYALDGWIYQDIFGNYKTGKASGYGAPVPSEWVDLLSRRWPLIVGLENPDLDVGHAYLLTAIYFYGDGDNITVDKVVLRDPWPKSESRQEMSWSTFTSRFMFGARLELYDVSTY